MPSKVIDHLSRQRWIDAENGTYARLSAEVPFDENGNVAPTNHALPETLLVTGSEAHSRYYSEDAQRMAPDTIDLLVVPGADHVDLYDRKDIIPSAGSTSSSRRTSPDREHTDDRHCQRPGSPISFVRERLAVRTETW